ncbi:MAG TPA: HDOD domain-containing protein [Anaeromyxobacteraceae bacterium]|nr:HDOD domain-containing protein [Anaeromyxobacteraceae bacterium]
MPDPDTSALDAAIVDLVSRQAVKVPPYPAVAMRVQELVRRDDYGLDELARLVESDQALAADALRVANSAFYSRGAPITTLPQAIGRIGAQDVGRLAMASGLGAHARAPGPLAALKRHVWLESLAAAALCQELARKRGLPVEEAFVCGLLHDFGKVLTVACIEEIVESRCVMVEPLPIDSWLEVVDRYHVELGVVLAARWELPPIVADVVSLHHVGAGAVLGAAEPRLVELVAAADEVVKLLTDGASISPDDLAAIPRLTDAERDLVARTLERLPGFIDSFEGITGGAATEPCSRLIRVEPPEKAPVPAAVEDLPDLFPEDMLTPAPAEIAPAQDASPNRALGAAWRAVTSASRRLLPRTASRPTRVASASHDRE